MSDVPVPSAPEAEPGARPAPVLIVVVPAGAVPAGSTVVLVLPAEALPDGTATRATARAALRPLPLHPPSVSGRRFTRKLREWSLAWWFAVAAAALEVPVSHVLAYYLHQHGLISPLEYWFPLD
ncbi:hypothetical protein ABZY30_05710 [Streptomyces massasporeus]|uniref:hypothetical protein n=1 Tax=Streptomyces massasporeus TaxID=67324 RepID=UPI0033A9B8BA